MNRNDKQGLLKIAILVLLHGGNWYRYIIINPKTVVRFAGLPNLCKGIRKQPVMIIQIAPADINKNNISTIYRIVGGPVFKVSLKSWQIF